uniref:Fatty acid hydroxylase domain-containing protein n=1 Tax=Panagrolaimus sp. PS1159 TaxID=55785 RepID=A0AC35ERI3_9BILA
MTSTASVVSAAGLLVLVLFATTYIGTLSSIATYTRFKLESTWNDIYSLFPSEFAFHVFGTTFYAAFIFWFFNIFFLTIDFLQPKWAKAFKIQEKFTLTFAKFLTAVPRILFNQFIVTLLVSFVFYYFYKLRVPNELEFPTFAKVIFDLTVSIFINELLFYYSHRAFHHPSIYKYIHKIHHEWTAPIGLVAIYAHPIEHILSNVTPVALGPVICASHPFTIWLWYGLALFSTSVSHSGYHFPFLPSPEAHDYHHFAFTQNFGVLGILDLYHGTNKLFLKTAAYKRHFLSLSLVPVKKLYPETTEKLK